MIPVCGPVDLAFLIDSSGSIGKSNFAKMLTFMKTLSRKLTVSPDSARIAVVSFGTEAMLHFRLNSHVTLKSTEAAIDQIRWKDQWANTGAALREMKDHVFKVCNMLLIGYARVLPFNTFFNIANSRIYREVMKCLTIRVHVRHVCMFDESKTTMSLRGSVG